MKKTVNMKDIADAVGVSRTTVSLVLSGRYQKDLKISDAIVQKVMKKAVELDYTRDEFATSIRQGSAKIIGVTGWFGYGFCMSMLKGISTYLAEHNYLMCFRPTEFEEDFEVVGKMLLSYRVGGVIIKAPPSKALDAAERLFNPRGIPLVLLDSAERRPWCSLVNSDNHAGAHAAVKYLLQMGHRRIAHITNNLLCSFAAERHAGYQSAMQESALSPLVFVADDQSFSQNNDQDAKIAAFLAAERPSAVFCSSDQLAARVLIAAGALAIRIPEELSIIGFGGLDFAGILSTPLTTVAQPFDESGKKAAELLTDIITKNAVNSEVLMPVSIVERNSVARYANTDKNNPIGAVKK